MSLTDLDTHVRKCSKHSIFYEICGRWERWPLWKQRCERPRFGLSPFATFLHESTHPEKKYGCTCHFNIASPTGKPQEQNSLHKIKLHNWKPKKPKKNKKKQRFQRKVGGLIVAGSLVFFLFFSVFVFFWWFCLLYRLSIGVVLPWKCFLHISWTARPNFRFSGGGGSVCVIFFWARNTTLFSKEWTNIIYCILFKETCIKACCTVVSERATAYWRIPFQNNAIFPARNTILLQMAIPCIALYYRHITLFQRDCCIYERVPFCTTTYCKSHHTQPYSVTRTAVCLEGYFSKRCYILLKGRLWVTVYYI